MHPARRRAGILAAILSLTLLAAACSSGNNQAIPSPTPTTAFPSPSPSHSPKGPKGDPTGKDLPLGTFSVLSGSPSCAVGGDCRIDFQVDCPGVRQAAEGTLIATGPGGQPKGVILGFIGTLGTGTLGLNKEWVDAEVADGFEVIVVSWATQTPWLMSSPGEEVGPKVLACRPATSIKWIHDNIYQKLTSPAKGKGACGFCATGNSGGASQIAYSLSFYGVADLLDAAIMTSGPPHAALDQACLGGGANMEFDADSASIIDLSYGFDRGTGPCVHHDQSFAETWKKDSVETGGTYKFPDTRVVFLFVDGDHTAAPFHGEVYLAKVRDAGSPTVSDATVPGFSHTIMSFPAGRQAVEDALLAKD